MTGSPNEMPSKRGKKHLNDSPAGNGLSVSGTGCGSTYYCIKTQTYQAREPTAVEIAITEQFDEGSKLLVRLAETTEVSAFRPELQGAIFCGHLVADLDSIAGAIGASILYGGTPARASEINSETQFALDHWKVKDIAYIEDLVQAEPDRAICLVDFQQKTQLHDCIDMSKIVGIIDHHALQNSTIVTEKPIFVDIRPWGSMSSILAYEFSAQRVHLPAPVAGMLLSAILSDTLNLRSPTTTEWDRRVVSMLVQYCKVEDSNLLCTRQFKAKSMGISLMSAYTLVQGDLKQFKFCADSGEEYQVAYSVVETTDPLASLARASELVTEMRTVKMELATGKKLHVLYLAIVDIVNLKSYLLLIGEAERTLAEAAYGENTGVLPQEVIDVAGDDCHRYIYDLGTRVSRKADFVPPISKAVANGWHPPMKRSATELVFTGEKAETWVPVVDYSHDPSGEIVRRVSVDVK
eukprot:CAMPEP_0198198074 /NCGR_PEP_ID=MMETSP1445-20131203/1580_1 /TAXON_ID=36898 /ORGANISM="Pyramimonas sp., Strain CCMP2087" /LENGTH=464 /DNA_ID=CAMNT_0043867521 /DNA_START=149 /DNA_END=1543 /DNA_ORIENTATION=+